MRSCWMKMGPKPTMGILLRRGKFGHTDTCIGRTSGDDGGRDWTVDSTSQRRQGMPATKHGRTVP